jgi:LmbE family N-acetylglucosaminyl deacetylase
MSERDVMEIAAGLRPVTESALPPGARLLVLAPHPDDFDAIAVTLRHFFRLGHPLDVAVFRTGSGVEDHYRPGLSLAGRADLREVEQRASLRFFGLPETNLTFLTPVADDEDQPADCIENETLVVRLLRDRAPDLVFLPHGRDSNAGHRTVAALLERAAAAAGRPLSAWLNRDAKTLAMRMDLYMPFDGAAAAWKAQLLRFHDSQQQRNLRTRGHGFDERVLDLNRRTAEDLGIRAEFAEVFERRSWP